MGRKTKCNHVGTWPHCTDPKASQTEQTLGRCENCDVLLSYDYKKHAWIEIKEKDIRWRKGEE